MINHQYTYEPLGKMEEENEDWVQFYGVIIDASFPYKISENRYMCNLKVIDSSLNVADNSEDQYTTVLIEGRRFQDLPIVQRVGDIIRCHRAEYKNRDGEHFLKLNLFYNSSWSLFSADNVVAPEVEGQIKNPSQEAYAFSGYSYTMESIDQKQLDTIRAWGKKHFSNHKVIIEEMYTPLSKADDEDGDFNVLGRITQTVNRDEYTQDI